MPNDIIITPTEKNISFQDGSNTVRKLMITGSNLTYQSSITASALFTTNGKGRIYATASYALATAGTGAATLTTASYACTGTQTVTLDCSKYCHILTFTQPFNTTLAYSNRKTTPQVDSIYVVFKWAGGSGGGLLNLTDVNLPSAGSLTFVSGKADAMLFTSYQGTSGKWIGSYLTLNASSTGL